MSTKKYGYIHKTIISGGVIEHVKCFTHKYHPPGVGRVKHKETPEELEAKSWNRKEKDLTRLLNTNYRNGDFHITLTYGGDQKPGSMKELKAEASAYLRKVKRAYSRTGQSLKYVYVPTLGKSGTNPHIHLIANRLYGLDPVDNLALFQELWTDKDGKRRGWIKTKTLYSEPQFKELAAYLIRNAKESKEKNKRAFIPSQNLDKPIIHTQRIAARRFSLRITPPRGYELEKGSVYEGSTRTGYPYITYTFIRKAPKVSIMDRLRGISPKAPSSGSGHRRRSARGGRKRERKRA